MLWASENGGITPIHLQDVPDNGSLNQMIRNVKRKLSTGVLNGPASVTTGETDTQETGEATAWAVSSQSIVQELNRMHESREAERARKEQNMSLLKTLNPSQKERFTNLCKCDFVSDPVMSPFMTALITTSSPQKAIAVLKVEAGDWEGTFSEGCCHRFLSNGFLSLEASRGIPGGFTVVMFHPKTIDIGGKAFDTHTATLREYFDLDVEDATIAYYAKQGFFHPTNPHNLRIQLESAMEMLELLTCPTRSQPTGCTTSWTQKCGVATRHGCTTDSYLTRPSDRNSYTRLTYRYKRSSTGWCAAKSAMIFSYSAPPNSWESYNQVPPLESNSQPSS